MSDQAKNSSNSSKSKLRQDKQAFDFTFDEYVNAASKEMAGTIEHSAKRIARAGLFILQSKLNKLAEDTDRKLE